MINLIDLIRAKVRVVIAKQEARVDVSVHYSNVQFEDHCRSARVDRA